MVAFCTALALSALAQKQKSTGLAGFRLLWSAKKTSLTGPFVPGLNAALLLNDEQKEKLIAAREEILGSEKLQKLGGGVKLNLNACEAKGAVAKNSVKVKRNCSRFGAPASGPALSMSQGERAGSEAGAPLRLTPFPTFSRAPAPCPSRR